MFHASLLSPYHATDAHGPSYSEPPPDLIGDEEEYEIEAIVNHKKTPEGKARHYVVKWKGYPTSHNSKLTEDAFEHAQDILLPYKKRHKLK